MKMKSTTEIMDRHYNEQSKRNVEDVALTRGQCGWQVERLPIHGCRIVDNTGRVIVADVYDEVVAEQIVAEHNEILRQRTER